MKWALIFSAAFLFLEPVCCWNDGSVLLRDIQVLTLYKDRYTTGRRSSPMPQLQCMGGSAGCHAFAPDVVQCQNKGWDGVDVQWECKTDMDNKYRFGRIDVSCEGYNHPSDPYVLTGSCGLEYTLELTEEGRRKNQGQNQGSGGFGGFASSFFSGSSGHKSQSPPPQSSFPSDGSDSGGLLGLVLLLLIAFGIYKLFLSQNTATPGPQPGGPQPGGSQPGVSAPPPPGFHPDYTSTGYPDANPSYGFSSDYTQGQNPYTGGRSTHNTGPAGGGFWTGMGTGGILGYLFGRQRSQPYPSRGYYGHTNNYSRPFTSTYTSSSSSSSPSPPSGTRTASGFGGTKRR
ncbi:store-operated calcium entry-associated regulatory factor isoform X2 [Eucyclogobius newberryi]|uniref:store-operated calcium entry-associated regulatory factor isoform X2 n=1 Tax=Eucyclogobius newberryi TaxID=166745 RepID=UPI003B5A9866